MSFLKISAPVCEAYEQCKSLSRVKISKKLILIEYLNLDFQKSMETFWIEILNQYQIFQSFDSGERYVLSIRFAHQSWNLKIWIGWTGFILLVKKFCLKLPDLAVAPKRLCLRPLQHCNLINPWVQTFPIVMIQ